MNMAPGITNENVPVSKEPLSYDVNLPYKPPSTKGAQTRTEFPQYLPSWEDKTFYDEVDEFDYSDPALKADKQLPLLTVRGVSMTDITPKMGTIVTGLNLEETNEAVKDEIALLISRRKVVVFRGQLDFLKQGPGFQQDFMSYFGTLNVQPVSGSVEGHAGFHIIHRDNNQDEIEAFLRQKSTSCLWHQDVSYERQPPGYVMLGILACPDVGGDTVFADTCEAYK